MQVGVAAAVDPRNRRPLRHAISQRRCRPEALNTTIKLNQCNGIARAQFGYHVLGAALGLFQRPARHRAGPVEHKCQRLRRALFAMAGGRIRRLDADQDVDGVVLAGAQASAAAVLEQAAGAHLLHFSCHCTANLAEPLKSSLRLANDETLSLGNILQQLNLSQNWLTILSACETNQADFHQANDEHLSLATGVVLAGAATVWSTLWAVNDASAALLLIEAMRRLGDNGGDKSAALQAAQQWLRTATVGDVIPLLNERIQQLPFNKLRTTLINLREQMLDAEHPQWMPFSHPYHWAAWQSVGS